MTEKLSKEQKTTIASIEHLRIRKDGLKKSIIFLNNQIVDIDIEIRRLRVLLPTLTPIIEKPKRITKHKETPEETLARLVKIIEDMKRGIKINEIL